MAVDWCDVLNWTDDQLQDLRFTGYGYLSQGHYERAIIFFDALVALRPDSLYDLQVLGALLLQIGDAEGALKILERAIEIEATDPITKLNKTKALFQLGYRNEGLILARELAASASQPIQRYADALLLAFQ